MSDELSSYPPPAGPPTGEAAQASTTSTALAPSAPSPAQARPCPMCGGEWGPGIACQSCNQVGGLPQGIQLSTAGRRLGGYALDLALAIVTLFIGYLVWTLIVWGRGQTPGKQLLGMRVVDMNRSVRASWGKMFVRDFLLKGLVFSLILGWIGIILDFWLLWDQNRQELWDKIAGTIVVNDFQKQLA
jgi:hypothetical protein